MIITKRFVTLIEMIIVMVLIGIILGVVAYNYSGTLDEGRAFKTRTAKEKLETILNLYVSENPGDQNFISSGWEKIVKDSPLVQNPDSLIKDGWGTKFEVEVDSSGTIKIHSKKFEEYIKSHPTSMFKEEKSN